LNCTPATPTLSDAVAEIVTALPDTVAPFAGAETETVGGVVSEDRKSAVKGEGVVILPAASRATAVSVWLLFEAVVVFHETLYGLAASSAPRLAPSSLNWTPATPTLSDAVAETVTVLPDTVAPFAGAEIETVGGVV